ncbi:hypothetical protein EGH21_07265 [Halomicroarcula sp. F13]|uniref:DUF1102 domain-containing protein n=1 Tax=Haloarcula rubra TaxID=2487747 RepID=A0AAW4PR04_9EURY|nr:hypothetical protein [Halomicroarcula rubra]MBX0322828.1 hypothetical protein [Halomicroarcula rubra]
MVRRYLTTGVALFVVVVSLSTGPLAGADVTNERATDFGEGTATVSSVDVEAASIRVTDGRFGTGVEYVRPPTATVSVESVTGRPRLVYLVSIPNVDVELVETTVVTGPGTYRLEPEDHGMATGTADAGTYDGTLTVRVQSFTADRTVYRENVTVEVAT